MGTQKHFKTRWILYVIIFCVFPVGISVTAWADPEKMLMTFEEFIGADGNEIGDFYPGVIFEAVQSGWEWVAADVTTNGYNASSWPSGRQWNNGAYWLYGYVWAWTGTQGKTGKIVFDNSYTFSVELGYTSRASITLTAYDADGNPIDEDNGEANLRLPDGAGNQDGPGTLSVTAPGGESIHSVSIDCEENSWVVDNIQIGSKLDVVKFDDVNDPGCRRPGDDLVYTIGISSPYRDQTNITIEDHLPWEVDFIGAEPDTGTFDWLRHTYTWHLDELDGYDPNDPLGPSDPNTYFYLYTQVNETAEPAGEIVNTVTVESDQWQTETETATPICWWGGEVIYVDKHAPGPPIGTSWQTAYDQLQDGLARAGKADDPSAITVLVADGTYYPSDESSEYPEGDTFEIPAGVSVYGGYAGWGAADPNARDPNRFHTILSGYVDESTNNNTVVTMGNNTLLDGVTVEEGYLHGIDGSDVFSMIKNCIVKSNIQEGINCEDGDLTIQWCKIHNNGYRGIYHSGSGNSLTIENCKIYDNQRDGIRTLYSTLTILNSLIYQNGSGSTGSNIYYGINLVNPSGSPKIRNNTIVYNANEGIRRTGGSLPDVRNCIVYYNNDDEEQLAGMNLEQVYYCCIPDCNEINSEHNIEYPPDFVYNKPPYGYYHIKYESPCREAGDPDEQYYAGINETDMDHEYRIQEYEVDIGADEVSCEDTFDPNDWTYDGVINYEDFIILSRAWLSCDPNTYDPPKNPDDEYIWYTKGWGFQADLNKDSCVNLADLELFLDNWLWKACWWENYMAARGMAAGNGESMSMMSQPFSVETLYSVQSLQAEPVEPVYESIPAEQIESITEILDFLDTVLEEDNPENEEGILEIKAILENWLDEIKL